MGSYTTLKGTIESAIYENSVGAITGNVMQTILSTLVDSVGLNANFMGMLGSGNLPSTTDGKQFYLAITPGTYNLSDVGLGTLSVSTGDIYVVYADSTGWHSANLSNYLQSSIASISSVSSSVSSSITELQRAWCKSNGVRVTAPEVGTYAIIEGGIANMIYNATDDVFGDAGSGQVQVTTSNADVYIVFVDETGISSGLYIPPSAFVTSNITSVTFPSVLRYVGESAFESNPNIISMTFYGAVAPQCADGSFTDLGNLTNVYVPDCSLGAYQTVLGVEGVPSNIISSIESTY